MKWFKRALVPLLLFFAGLSFAGQGPHIHAAEMKYDFGKVKAGERAEHLFEIKNSGDEVLVIQKVQSS